MGLPASTLLDEILEIETMLSQRERVVEYDRSMKLRALARNVIGKK